MSVWRDIHERSNGKAIRKEDLIDYLKEKIKVAAKQYVEDYIDAMFDSECTVKEIQDQYQWAFIDNDAEWVFDRMEKEDQNKLSELDEEDEYELCDYADAMVNHFADEIIPALKEEEEEE